MEEHELNILKDKITAFNGKLKALYDSFGTISTPEKEVQRKRLKPDPSAGSSCTVTEQKLSQDIELVHKTVNRSDIKDDTETIQLKKRIDELKARLEEFEDKQNGDRKFLSINSNDFLYVSNKK